MTTVVVYIGLDHPTALAVLEGRWKSRPVFLYKSLEHAIKKAKKLVPHHEMVMVLELHYNKPRTLCYNPHKHGYHTSRKPLRARIKWVQVNGGELFYNYQKELAR